MYQSKFEKLYLCHNLYVKGKCSVCGEQPAVKCVAECDENYGEDSIGPFCIGANGLKKILYQCLILTKII
jgi:hypothetical protein